ncbi:NACHT, LRR and PYD domains-containing protein 12-like [Astyanax mexicanus]|uniref:NACHT, LRR and PYD domains-containing protein 12-like n=1 Tax=Astyanax mexicanus TaxID=7994 RepID=UPI0020CADD45|nr:NACHT, LRR and PYD domains-containing protein 12-like [Astyanax mexicanus]
MKHKYHHVCEGIAKQGESTSLNKIYTDLYITEGGAGHVNKEHEVRRIEKNQMQQDVQIECRNMFELLPGQDRPIRTVLTQGVAGIGKSICVQKFILDWAEGEHRDIQFIFPLPFRELNLVKEDHSLMDIISFFFPETKGLILTDLYKVMFILDGLDECQLPLSFQKNEILQNVCKQASLDVVLTNLIKGNLLPSAQIWITTRPAAASMIPAECVDRVSEVRGFNDQQKEEYFRRRISDQVMANKIIEYIKQSRSLFIMCHIPVFCWISATVLQKILQDTESEKTPKTLTNMYTCFLIFQAVQGNVKYTGKNALDIPWNKEAILALGKLAFQQLEENNLIFYAGHLKACEIDPSKISVYSGLCTQETVRFLGTVFSFVHLSIQEFLAALFAYLSLRNDNRNVFQPQSSSQESKTTKLDFFKTAVDKALESDHGHLDLFLRFLLGLSLESNEVLIRGLLTQTGSSSDCRKEIVEYIKIKFRENPSPERSINLIYCLNELNDDSLVKEIQSYMSSGRLAEAELSPAQWSALVFVLLTSKEKLEEFDLKKFIRSEECLNRLLPVVQEATSVLLSDCNLTERSCSALLRVLSSESSTLTLLDLSNNPIQDCGVELLSNGLKSSKCKLETLSLSDCGITVEGYAALASALKSNPSSHLIELDLRGNDPGDTGVKKLHDLLVDPQHKLSKLRLCDCNITDEGSASLCSALKSNPSHIRELELSNNRLGDSGIKHITDLLQNPNCLLEKLMLNNNGFTEKDCADLEKAFRINPSHLKELDLSGNKLGNSGVKKMSDLLKMSEWKLTKLNISDCSVTEEGYADLVSALKSNSSLVELDLRDNDPGNTGVKKFTDLLKEPNCKLKTVRFLKTSAAEEACASLSADLGVNLLLQTELNLSRNPAGLSGDSRVKLLCDLLQDTHCKLRKLKNNDDDLTEESCFALASILTSSSLVELDLSNNNLQDSGVKKLCMALKDPLCKLETLRLSYCCVREDGYKALVSALSSNASSRLGELDLRGNDPGDRGVELLVDLFVKQYCNQKKLRLLKSDAAEEAYTHLKRRLDEDPLVQRKLDLSKIDPNKITVKQMSELLEDPHCRLRKLTMYKAGSIRETDCTDLISALIINPSHLIELNLNENKLDIKGLLKLCDLLKNSHCKLEKLSLSGCCIAEEGYAALASALKSNPSSSLREFDLRGNNPGNTGVELITDPDCKLKTLRLLKSSAAEEVCASLTKVLGINPLLLRDLDLSGKLQGDSGIKQLPDLLKDPHCRTEKIKLKDSRITEEECAALLSALCSNPSHLVELDLSGSKVGNSGVETISQLLKNSEGKMKKLNLSDCSISEKGYSALASALKSNPTSPLMELDLRGNDPGDKGVKLLTDLKEEKKYNLIILRLLKSPAAEKICASLSKILQTNPLLLTKLDLSRKIKGESEAKQLSDLLKDLHCRTQIVRLNNCSITEKGCESLSAALCSNPSHLIELDLSDNNLGNSGVKHICTLLTSQYSKLQRLVLSCCSVTGEGYDALTSALKSNSSSPLIELDLRGNDPENTGEDLISYFTCVSKGTRKTLRLLKSDDAEEAYNCLKHNLQKNPLLPIELNLSKTEPQQIKVKPLSALLEDPHCKLKKLIIYKTGSITERDCDDLISALVKNPSHLKQLDLNKNKLDRSGLQKLCDLLKNPHCRLEQLSLNSCCISEDGYVDVASALESNPSSHLVALDLRDNDPGDTGVKLLSNLLNNQHRKLKTIRLLNSSAAEDFCDSLTEALGTNTLLLTELNLSEKITGDSAVQQLSDLLKDLHCRTKILK